MMMTMMKESQILVLGLEINDPFFDLFVLPVDQGGLGIQNSREILPAAYTASYLSYLQCCGFNAKIAGLRRVPPNQLPSRQRQFLLVALEFKVTEDNPINNIVAISRIQLWTDSKLYKVICTQ
jgi:hypothetical protein